MSSGLHSEFFDDVWITRPWGELDLSLHFEQIQQRLDEMGGYYLPGSDLEARWLAKRSAFRILVPPLEAFEHTSKPFEMAEKILPVRVPEFIALDAGPRETYNFAVDHGWKVWVKGPVMDAQRVHNWQHLQFAWGELAAVWGEQRFFLQRDVPGMDVTVAFAAHDGRLLGTAFMEKRQLTGDGKCWAGEVTTCSPDLVTAIASLTEHLKWTGGGELEFIREESGQLWLIDLNYRFPAWIHGATLAGINLPASLIEAVSGVTPLPARCESRQFTRLVMEIPVLNDLQFPSPPKEKKTKTGSIASKLAVTSPGGLPQLMQRLFTSENASPSAQPDLIRPKPPLIDPNFEAAIRKSVVPSLESPARILLADIAKVRFDLMRDVASVAYPIRLSPAYSIKTNPDRRLMEMARRAGFRAEAISIKEALWAREAGFRFEDIIYNGPVPLEPTPLEGHVLHAVFADSLESFCRLCDLRPYVARTIGLRLSPFGSESRFGVRLEHPDRFRAVSDAIIKSFPTDVGFGVHHHLQSSVMGPQAWLNHTRAIVEQAKSLENITGRKIQIFDIGGGWTSESFVPFIADHLHPLLDHIHNRLPNVEEVIIEPGKAICEQSQVLVSRVLETRGTDCKWEIVVDTCLAEIPLAVYFPRDVYHLTGTGKLTKLTSGVGRILGRVCMEHDILASGITIPPETRVGDFMIFSHAGGYESSMSYRFGVGGFHE
ncbi:MAG: hypothetical protein D4S02_15890 [Rhodocyclaceae bacterium]|nr:MAG: hypothetical protein D4S02_15890 [Rhodocyclaceae bacterium]